jgi:L-threonylcarbamoyladenylate synthase
MSLVADVLSSAFMPGPFTLVSPKKETCAEIRHLNPEFDTLGVRVPDHDIALSILETIDQPVVATSANLSGSAPAISVEEVENYFGDADVTLLDIPSACAGMASTVVEVKDNGYPVVLREGKITEVRIQQVLEEAALVL